jgi:hypothetical protein
MANKNLLVLFFHNGVTVLKKKHLWRVDPVDIQKWRDLHYIKTLEMDNSDLHVTIMPYGAEMASSYIEEEDDMRGDDREWDREW